MDSGSGSASGSIPADWSYGSMTSPASRSPVQAGGSRAGGSAGGCVGSPMGARIAWIGAGSVTNAMVRISPEQRRRALRLTERGAALERTLSRAGAGAAGGFWEVLTALVGEEAPERENEHPGAR